MSVTAKTQDAQLKRAISRQKRRQTKTDFFDHALPIATRFTGIIKPHSKRVPEITSTESHDLSPFVLSLKIIDATPEELLQQIPQLNLLHGYSHTPAMAISNQDDLALTEEELRRHLGEQVAVTEGWSKLSLPLKEHHVEMPRISLAQSQDVLTEESQHFHTFNTDTFIPSSVPEDIFAFFDIPDEERLEDESEVVTLEEIGENYVEEPQKTSGKHTWQWNLDWALPGGVVRTLASFVALSFVVVLPLHAMNVVQDLKETRTELVASGEAAVSLLSSGAQAALNRDGALAANSFAEAGARFDEASQSINTLGLATNLILTALPVTGDDYRSGKALIRAGEELSIAGTRMADGLRAVEAELYPTPISRLALLEMHLSAALPHLELAREAFEDVNLETLPEAHQETATALLTQLPALESSIQEFLSFYEIAHTILGGDGTRRYLLIFQNNTEIRPTGGFIGSFAELKVRDGVIEEMNVPGGGSYDLQGSMRTAYVAPEPLQLLSAKWEFQDGNWFPDFPSTARQLLQFYQDAGGPSVDGVIAINATYVAELIGLMGPIEMPEYNRIIDAENFIFEAQRIVEIEYDREENKPKAFIGDLAPKLMERALEQTSSNFLNLLTFVDNGLTSRDVQLYFSDSDTQREILAHGWGGAISGVDGDYLMVVDTNLGGGKTDGVIEEDINVNISIDEDGSITNTVEITRTHHGIRGLLFTGVNNVDYMRVYVPKGSKLVHADGFSIPDQSLFEKAPDSWVVDDDLEYVALTQEQDPLSGTTITEEHGKTVFGNWVQTKPGTSSTVTFTYKLPFTIEALSENPGLLDRLQDAVGIPSTEEYTLLIQKQAGVLDRETAITLTAPNELSAIWTSHSTEATISNDTDAFFGALFEY